MSKTTGLPKIPRILMMWRKYWGRRAVLPMSQHPLPPPPPPLKKSRMPFLQKSSKKVRSPCFYNQVNDVIIRLSFIVINLSSVFCEEITFPWRSVWKLGWHQTVVVAGRVWLLTQNPNLASKIKKNLSFPLRQKSEEEKEEREEGKEEGWEGKSKRRPVSMLLFTCSTCACCQSERGERGRCLW